MNRAGLRDFTYEHLPVFAQNWACSLHGLWLRGTRFGKEFRRFLDWLDETQWWTHQELREYQDQRLRGLIAHAYENVPYYRRVMDERGLKPADIETVDDLPKLPVLTKDIVRQAGKDLISRAVRRRDVIHRHTSGTTGAGLQFIISKEAYHFQWATWWRHRRRFGIEQFQPYANFSGQLVVPLRRNQPPFWRENRPLRQTYLSLYHMTPEHMPAYVEMLERRKFRYYVGYPSGIYVLADYLRSISHRLSNPPEMITTGAESLMPFQIQAFTEWINAPCTEHYGLAECTANISHCEHRNYHVDMEFAIVEPVEVGRVPEGRMCRIIGTSLHSYAMPFIRYDTDDVATFSSESCPCGREADLVKYIDGRVESYVITPEGRRIGRMDHCFKDMVSIRECQIVQDEIGKIQLRIVRADSYGPQDEALLRRELRTRVGDSLEIDIQYVDSIPRTQAGKFRAVISRIESQYMPGMAGMKPFLGGSAATRDSRSEKK